MNIPQNTTHFVILTLLALTAISSTTHAASLADALDAVDPDISKWATVVTFPDAAPDSGVDPVDPAGAQWHHYGDNNEQGLAIDFWPASTIKVQALVAGLELLNELDMPVNSTLIFQRRSVDDDGHPVGDYVTDCGRTFSEMSSEVFRASDNTAYTLSLRFVGVDRINTRFFTEDKGFQRTALMRDYTRGRPDEYVNTEPQRIVLVAPDGTTKTVEHHWSGKSYNAAIGGHVISAETGNSACTRDMAEHMRRLIFHRRLPQAQRYHITDKQHAFVIDPASTGWGEGLHGLRNKNLCPAFEHGVAKVFPDADYYHKSGSIPGGGDVKPVFADMAYVHDTASGKRFIMVIATESRSSQTLRLCGEAIAQWVLKN